MKLNGIIGKGTGKLGSSVFAISGGEQIVRQYNPVVSNPNTEAQLAQRAKLKLMSQLGATLAPALGFAKMGIVSARNQFVSKNIGECSYSGNIADVNLVNLQLTASNVALPSIVSDQHSGGILEVKLASPAAGDIKRVAYFVFKAIENSQLQYVASTIVTEAGEDRDFEHSFNVGEGDYVVYAYGIKDNSVNATIKYKNYVTSFADEEATLSVIPLFRTSDYGLTKTSGLAIQVTAS